MEVKCKACGDLFANISLWKIHNRREHSRSADFDLVWQDSKRPSVDPTPRSADECKKLLDSGWSIIIYRNGLDSYTAMATKTPLSNVIHQFEEKTGLKTSVITDDFEPSAALYRLTEKVFGNIV